MESKLFELLPYTKRAIEANVSLENIFDIRDETDRQIVTDLHKK